MAEDRKWTDIDRKVQGAGIGGAFGILIVFIIDQVYFLDATAAAVLTTSLAVIVGWLLPETLPWNRKTDDDGEGGDDGGRGVEVPG